MLKAPCKNCPYRHPRCHSSCEKYLEYRKEQDRINEERRVSLHNDDEYWKVKNYRVRKRDK